MIASGDGSEGTFRTRIAVPVPPPFVAVKVTLNVPADKGVLEIRPVAVLTVIPVGNPVALKLVGPLVALI